jgi:hypothetical protein
MVNLNGRGSSDPNPPAEMPASAHAEGERSEGGVPAA